MFSGETDCEEKLAAASAVFEPKDAAFVAGAVAALMPLALHEFVPLSLAELGGLLLLVGIVGQVGDIVESAIKRDAGVKDAPALIPGHGGMLDRFDSYLFAFPLCYVYLTIVGAN